MPSGLHPYQLWLVLPALGAVSVPMETDCHGVIPLLLAKEHTYSRV
jgi:hypothetical protein